MPIQVLVDRLELSDVLNDVWVAVDALAGHPFGSAGALMRGEVITARCARHRDGLRAEGCAFVGYVERVGADHAGELPIPVLVGRSGTLAEYDADAVRWAAVRVARHAAA